MILECFFGDIEAKMVATWAKLEPSWQQVASKMGYVSTKTAMLDSVWLWLNLGCIFCAFWQMRWISKNIKKQFVFFKVFGGFGVVWMGWLGHVGG